MILREERSGGRHRPPPPQVVVYGTVCLDRFHFEEGPDEQPLLDLPGGEAFNTATALAGWGVDVALVGTAIGGDSEGDALRRLLDTHPLGLSRRYIPDDPAAVTPVCTVRVARDGDRAMSGRGFREAVAPSRATLAPLLAHRPVATLDPNLGEAAVGAALAAAEAHCPVVAMDFGDEPAVVRACRVLVTSREWLRGDETPEQAVRRLAAWGAPTAIVTAGNAGGVVWDRDAGLFAYDAVDPGVPIRDTTGAGDTFRAGLCYGLLQDWELGPTLRFAAAAAALHCGQIGGGSRVARSDAATLAGLLPGP